MNNAEKWKETIREFKGHIAVVNGEPVHCPTIDCDKCDFWWKPSCPNELCLWLCEESDK